MKVSVKACSDYANVQSAIDECLRPLGGMSEFVKKGDKVLLKANLLFGKSAEHAVCTNPEFVRAVIRIVKKAGGRPSVGDSPAMQNASVVGAKSGILEVCKQENVTLVNLDKPKHVKVNGNVAKSFRISSKLNQYDVLINLPKLKTHGLVGMTAAVKNLYGCIPGAYKGMYHVSMQSGPVFAELLMDLQKVVVPKLTIMDAVVGMEGQGPGSGNPRLIGAVIAGTNTVAIDTVAAAILGLKPKEVHTWKIAQKRELPGAYEKDIKVLGDRIRIKNFKRAKKMLILPGFLPSLLRNFLLAKPVLLRDKCISCGACNAVCPAHAIDFSRKYPLFLYKKCIRCYCCHEVCPKKAIPLKRGLIAKLVSHFVS